MAIDYHELIGRLPRAECDDLLVRLAEGNPGVELVLRKRLRAFLPQERPQPARRRTIQQLLLRAKQIELDEKMRQAKSTRRKHIAEMKSLAATEAQVWQQVDNLLETGRKIASVYDEATDLLEKLKQLSEFQDTRDVFQARLQQLAQKYSTRTSLIDRWRKHGWV